MADQGSPASETPARAVVAAAIDAQRKALYAQLDTGRGPLKPKAIHDLRVAIRRLLSALELADAIGYEVGPETLKRLRRLLSRLAPARDAHVQIRSLAPLRVTRPETELMIGALKERRRAATRKAKKRLKSFARADFDRDTSVVLGALSASPQTAASSAALETAWLGELAKRHLSVERRRRAMSESDPAALHRARLLLKEYRYALDALAPLLPDSAQRLANVCERLQEDLGKAHDAHVLAQTTRQLAEASSGAQSQALVELAEELERAGQAAHEAGARALAAAELDWPFSQALER